MRDDLGKRMKENYEYTAQTTLPKRLPTIIRLDGKAFHTFTSNCERPFDKTLHDTMVEVTKYLCENIQTCVFGYTQSDEISLLLHPYKKLDTQPWFGNNVQKMTSVSASFASTAFNCIYAHKKEHALEIRTPTIPQDTNWIPWAMIPDAHLEHKLSELAQFDSRVFVLPEAEVCNYFLWRQQDATRNSKQMLARSLYSHKECENKNSSMLQDMCMEKGQNWNNLDTWKKRGTAVYKITTHVSAIPHGLRTEGTFGYSVYPNESWQAIVDTPIFSQDRNFIEQHLKVENE